MCHYTTTVVLCPLQGGCLPSIRHCAALHSGLCSYSKFPRNRGQAPCTPSYGRSFFILPPLSPGYALAPYTPLRSQGLLRRSCVCHSETRERRSPMRLPLLDGPELIRNADRQCSALLSQLPPRSTRIEPVEAPIGSVTTPLA